MDRFHELRNKSNNALFKASMNVDDTNRVLKFFDDLLASDGFQNQQKEGKFFGPLPAHFTGASTPSSSNVLNPKKIITKGAPPTNKKMKRFHKHLKKN